MTAEEYLTSFIVTPLGDGALTIPEAQKYAKLYANEQEEFATQAVNDYREEGLIKFLTWYKTMESKEDGVIEALTIGEMVEYYYRFLNQTK